MLSNKKPQIDKFLEPVAKNLSSVNPNILTLLGSIPPLLFFVFVLMRLYPLALVAFVGNLFDMIDGLVARRSNKVTPFGGFLDSLIDRASDFLMITAFGFSGISRWSIVAPLLLFSFLTSYIRARGGQDVNSHMEFAIGLIERPERLAFLFFALLIYFIAPGVSLNGFNAAEIILLILTFLSVHTVFQRILYAYRKL